jgi:hypothetical protein
VIGRQSLNLFLFFRHYTKQLANLNLVEEEVPVEKHQIRTEQAEPAQQWNYGGAREPISRYQGNGVVPFSKITHYVCLIMTLNFSFNMKLYNIVLINRLAGKSMGFIAKKLFTVLLC